MLVYWKTSTNSMQSIVCRISFIKTKTYTITMRWYFLSFSLFPFFLNSFIQESYMYHHLSVEAQRPLRSDGFASCAAMCAQNRRNDQNREHDPALWFSFPTLFSLFFFLIGKHSASCRSNQQSEFRYNIVDIACAFFVFLLQPLSVNMFTLFWIKYIVKCWV